MSGFVHGGECDSAEACDERQAENRAARELADAEARGARLR